MLQAAQVKTALLLALCLALAACGGTKADPTATANRALLDGVPVYPGAAAPKTTTSGMGDVHFAARDWTIPASAQADTVVTWYEQRLQAAGWKITGKSFETLRATRRGASLSVGVRGHTLEAIANSEGA
jgi:ABC-type glycerol-3-phosphate transport system substrate-binding protein